MNLPSSSRWGRLAMACLVILNAVGCGTLPTATPKPPEPLPAPDPVEAEGDALYAIYRKGLITRHLTNNGRLLQTTPLTDLDPDTYDGSGYLHWTLSDGTVIYVPIDNARYSEEYVPGQHPRTETCLWIPVAAPTKYPGYSNDAYYSMTGGDDNPGYYGGMAMATFALEAIHGVSPYSLDYARRMVRYFLDSEMWLGNGYIIREQRVWSGKNRNGEPILRGASAEELLGIMLGLMFYLEAEETVGNPDIALYRDARALRDRILDRVPLFPTVCVQGYPVDPAKYEHPFMLANEDWSYCVSHFAFPLYASRGEVLDQTDGCSPSNDFFGVMTLMAGRSAIVETDFDNYLMYLVGMILILESEIPDSNKRQYAEILMDDFIKAAYTHGPIVDDIQDNAFWSVMALLADKYLDPDTDAVTDGQILRDIWDDDWSDWLQIKRAVDIVADPSSGTSEDGDSSKLWQHNLPLMNLSADRNGWQDHQPYDRIGKWFAWKFRSPYYWSGSPWEWLKSFPGTVYDASWADLGGTWDVATYRAETGKKYTAAGFVDLELVARGHDDNQVEGAGLGLLFPRMLLTHIDPDNFPPPVLPDRDVNYPLLPWMGVVPNSPQFLRMTHRYYSKEDELRGQYKVEGDQDQALRLITLGDEQMPGSNFVVGYATDDERLELTPGFVTDGYDYGGGETIPAGIYLGSELKSETGGRFDKMEMARTEDEQGREYIVVAERAEDTSIGFDFCRDHWLRVSLFRIDGFAEGHVGSLTRLDKWVSDSRNCDGVEDLDLTIVNDKYAAVLFRSHEEHHRLCVFELDFSASVIRPVYNEIVSEDLADHSIGIATAYDDILVRVAQDSSGWRLVSERWTGSERQGLSQTSHHTDEQLLDMTAIQRFDFSQPGYVGGYYVVAVTKKERHLRVLSWEVTPDGRLVAKGQLNTEDAENYLLGREADWERASITSLYWDYRPGYAIVGKGVAREVRALDGDWQQSAKGLKVLYGYILVDGRPTLESSNILGSGDASAMRMLDASSVSYGFGGIGVIAAHKTKDDYLMLTYWDCRDDWERYR